MTKRYTKRRGFTLVEILIVVIILGILAAIVIPQFTNASSDAREKSAQSQLQTLRSQIELYKLQHRDTAPDFSAHGWDQMTSKTDEDGTINTSGAKGAYLQQSPTNPQNGSADVAVNATDPSVGTAFSGKGYVYSTASGKLFATDADNKVTAD